MKNTNNNMIQKTIDECIGCNRCTKHCDFLEKYEINLLDFVSKPELAYSCFLCDKCKFVCPKDLSGQEISLTHRQNSNEHSKITRFLKEDYIFKNIPKKYTETILFLGCNYPSYYPKTCNKLIDICSKMGIDYSIDCCKKPIIDDGAEFNYQKMSQDFINSGVKKIICTCPNCYHTFKRNLKNLEIINVYNFLKENNIGTKITDVPNIFFPCSDRYKREIFKDIEFFLTDEYKDTFKEVNCCGLGGNAKKNEAELLNKISEKMHSYNAPNIYTYCSSCSGIFNSYKLKNIRNFLSEILDVHENVSDKYFKNTIKNKLKRRK